MAKPVYKVHGRITRRDTNAGIHGLTVEAWDEDFCGDDCLGIDLTNSDGRFYISFNAEAFKEPFEGHPEVYLKIKDCEGRVIYDTRSQCMPCEPGKDIEINVELVPDILWWHLNASTSWVCPEDGLLPASVITDIQEAIRVLNNKNSLSHFNAFLCTIPPIHHFDAIIRDAWQTLQGDLDAAQRYREILETLCAFEADQCCSSSENTYANLLHTIFDEEWEVSKKTKNNEPPCQCQEDEVPREEECDPDTTTEEIPCPCKESFVSNEKATILFLAALHISCRHEGTAKTYLSTLLNQLCRFEYLGALHRSSVKSICGDSNARGHFIDLLEFVARSKPGRFTQSHCCENLACCCETCLDMHLEACLKDAVRAWSCIHCYVIEEIKPARACTGEEITICGKHFGDEPGQIIFRDVSTLNLTVSTTPTSWSDEVITVRVPPRSACGIALRLPAQTEKVCGGFLEYHPHGCIKQDFEGGQTFVKLCLFNLDENNCLPISEPIGISWISCNADRTRIIVREEDGTVLYDEVTTESSGVRTVDLSDIVTTSVVVVEAIPEGPCQPRPTSQSFRVAVRYSLTVEGIEVTQAIQYFGADQHLTDPGDIEPDHSVQLVQNKRAVVRVYVDTDLPETFDMGTVPGVTGELIMERFVNGTGWVQIGVFPPINTISVVADSDYDFTRGDEDNTA